MRNVRRTLAIKIATPGGDNPLLVDLVGRGPFVRGIAVTGLALAGRGGTSPYAFSIVAGSLPTGLSLDALSGAITGTPSVAGHFSFVAKIQDAGSNVFQARFSIDVVGQLFLVAGTPTPGEVGVAYSYQFIVRDVSGTTITSGYLVTSGNLPAGLSLLSSGLLTGTPTEPHGISYFTATVTDGTDSLDIPASVTIYSELQAADLGVTNVIINHDTQIDVAISGGLQPYSISMLTGVFPDQLKYSRRTGQITGVQRHNPGGYLSQWRVTDAMGATATYNVPLRVIYPTSINSLSGDVLLVSSDPAVMDVQQNSAGDVEMVMKRPGLRMEAIPGGVSIWIAFPDDE